LQLAPAQQAVPGSPHGAQTPELTLQAVPGAVQTLPAQHAAPAVPQALQVEPLHRVPAAVHAPPGQQG
jgi:hypothetical protein